MTAPDMPAPERTDSEMTEREMTDTDRTDTAFLELLASADPVDPATLPAAADPAARRLVDSILAADPAHGALTADGAVTADDVLAADPAVQLVDVDRPAVRPRRAMARGRALLVASAAAVLLLVGAVAVLAPDNTSSALAEVQGAAAATADADTGRIETTFALHHDGGPDGEAALGSFTGSFEAAYNGGDLGFSLRLDELPAQIGADLLEAMPSVEDVRLVDDVVYVEQGGQWMAIETDGLLGRMVTRFVDPRTVLDTVRNLSETTEVGPAEIDGLETTHYRSVVDLGDDSLSQSGWLAFEGVGIEAEGEVTIDLYVDGDGVLRRFDLTGDIREPVDGGESGTFEVTTRFTDIGADIEIEVPDGAIPFDPMAELFDE